MRSELGVGLYLVGYEVVLNPNPCMAMHRIASRRIPYLQLHEHTTD